VSFTLTEQDKEAVRYHLGFFNVDPSASITLGFPAGTEPMFLVERAMNRISSQYAISRIKKILVHLEFLEESMMGATQRLQALQVDEIKIRNSRDEVTEQDELEHEYNRWAHRLAESMGVPLNPMSRRFGGAGPVTSIRVAHGA